MVSSYSLLVFFTCLSTFIIKEPDELDLTEAKRLQMQSEFKI